MRNHLHLIVVDYLQLISGDAKAMSRENQISDISRGLKAMAKELDVPVIVLSQLNRDSEKERRDPRLSDLRESGAIEQDADIVMMLYRDDYYNPGTDVPGVAEVNIVKNRSGMTGKVELFFSKEFTQFSNYSRQEQQ